MCSLRVTSLAVFAVFALLCPGLYASEAESAPLPASSVEHVPSWTHSLRDVGPVPGATLLQHLSVVVARDPEREQAFQQLLRDQYDSKSPKYHKWVTPRQLGERYGADPEALDDVSKWLSSHGLEVNSISNNRLAIDFSGTIAALSSALSVNFHYFDLNGERLISLTTEPRISSDVASKIRFIAGLSSVRVHPAGAAVKIAPDYDCPSGCTHVVSPADFAVIYGLTSVYGSGIQGAGQSIAVVGFSRVADSDVEFFQQLAGLPVQDPTIRIPSNGTDPGPPNQGANCYQEEATADVERAFGVAHNASVILDVTEGPQSPCQGGITDLLNLPIADVIDNDVAPILTISFSGCEADAGMPQVLFADSLFQQGAAEGISTFVAAGDSGIASCAPHGFTTPPPAAGTPTAVVGINYLCASSYVTCVGGTQFNDTSDPSEYWASTNSGDLLSALSYIPEGAWNQSSPTQLVAGGGGSSQWIEQSPWQSGVGVPINGQRNVPDVAFTASGHDAYYLCFAEPSGEGDCSQGNFIGFYGTSGSAPSMAGIMALVDQTLGVRQGNFSPTLYSLAATPSNGVFNDVTVASSGVASCSVGTPSLCNNSITLAAGSNPAVLPGFTVNPGYDLATGWGSINVANLLSALTSQSTPVASTTSLSVSADTIGTSQGTTLTVQVFGSAGTPTGTVQIFLSNGAIYAGPLAMDFGQVVLSNLTFPTAGTYKLVAQYSGDSIYAPSSSALVVINSVPPSFQLNASPTSVVVPNPGNQATTAITASTTTGYLGVLTLNCTVATSSGAPSGNLPTCALSPSEKISLTASNPASMLTLTIGTAASSATVAILNDGEPHVPAIGAKTLALAGLSLLSLFYLSSLGSSRTCTFLLAVLAIVSTTGWSGCNTKTGSAPGSYVVTVNATSMSSTVSTQVDVTVN